MYRGVLLATLALLLTGGPAAAQVSLRSQMSRLFETSLVLARTPAGVGLIAHTPTFAEDPVVRETTDLVNQISAQIGLQLANVPLGSSAGGFTYGLRGRYSFAARGMPGVAVGLDLRLPSGDADNMLGTGASQTRAFFIASGGRRVSPHVNLGYTVSSGNAAVPDEVTYAGGVEFGATPRITLLFDVFGQTSSDALRVQNRSTVHTFRQGPTAPIERTTLASVAVSPATLTTGMGAVGAKMNVWRNALVSANLLVPIAHAGLRSRASFVAGFDYTF